jgi:hypothetical protein
VLRDGCGYAFIGSNWAAFVSDLLAIGPFHDALGPNTRVVGEETLMQIEMMRRGINGINVPAARAWHYVPPERSSAAWALSRARKVGILLALLKREGDPKFFPTMRQDFKISLKFLYEGMKSRRAELLFEGRFRWCTFIGKVEGLLLRLTSRHKLHS